MAMTASKGLEEAPVDDCAGALLRSALEEDKRSVALIPSAEEELLAAWSCEAA